MSNTQAIRKQLVAAIIMVLVAAIALGSSTYAWFASNGAVKAQGMKVQATTEGGIEIAYNAVSTASGSATYGTTATAGMTAATALFPTSTLAASTNSAITGNWYHAIADAASASTSSFTSTSGKYAKLTLSLGNTASNIYGSTTAKQEADQYYDNDGKQYYLVKEFNVRSVSASQLAKELKVKSVTATASSTATSPDLDKSLRVAIVCGSNSVIYAPAGGNTSYKVATDVDNTTGVPTMPESANATALASTTVSSSLSGTDGLIAAKGTSTYGGVDVRVYIYYEGEDSNHFSNNITSALDSLDITIEFTADVS